MFCGITWKYFWHNENVTVHKDVYIGFPTNSSRTFSAFYSFYEFHIYISIKNENIVPNETRIIIQLVEE